MLRDDPTPKIPYQKVRSIAKRRYDGPTIRTAIEVYRQGNADFTDCMIAVSGRAAGCSRIVTFDHIAARDAGMELLT